MLINHGNGVSLFLDIFCCIFRPKATQTQTLDVRLPLEHGSDQRQTLAQRVSDDSRPFIF